MKIRLCILCAVITILFTPIDVIAQMGGAALGGGSMGMWAWLVEWGARWKGNQQQATITNRENSAEVVTWAAPTAATSNLACSRNKVERNERLFT